MDQSVERRLAAILITDVVGYSRMTAKDEAGTLRRLKTLRREVIDPYIAAARGRIVKSTGDGVLVEFPSSVRAVTCAVAIQRAAALYNAKLSEAEAMHMRIGINLGDVIAEPDGDLYGDGVNVAARLEPLAEPGGLCISRSIHDQVRDKTPYRFEDRGKLELKNIARPIGVFALSAAVIRDAAVEDEPEAAQTAPDTAAPLPSVAPPSAAPRARPRLGALWTAGALVVTVAGIGWGWWTWPRASLDDKTLAVQAGLQPKPLPALSLVVLPFTNLSSDPEQEFFVEGLTEDLTTDLSHLAGSFVIARNTAFTYKGKAVDVKQLGRDLGVRYALEGSARRTGEKVVLNAQLISTETGAHVWADRFEGERSRLGELQADFVARLARSLDVQLTQAEGLRILRERASNPTASDLSMLGWAALNRARTPANTTEARNRFEQSLQIDPSNPQAKIGLARAIAQAVNTRVSTNIDSDRRIAFDLAKEGLEANPQYPMAHYVMAEVLRTTKDFEKGLREIAIAIEYDPNMATAHALAGITELWAGRAAETFAHVERAIRLSPKDPSMNSWEYYICHAHTHLAQWEEAIKSCNRSIEHAPYYFSYIDIAASQAWLGHSDEAAAAVRNLLKLIPGYTIDKLANSDYSRNPTFLVEYSRIVEGLRKAGLPEK